MLKQTFFSTEEFLQLIVPLYTVEILKYTPRLISQFSFQNFAFKINFDEEKNIQHPFDDVIIALSLKPLDTVSIVWDTWFRALRLEKARTSK